MKANREGIFRAV